MIKINQQFRWPVTEFELSMYPYLLLIFLFSASANNGGNSAEKCWISVSIQKSILMELWKAGKHAENSKLCVPED